MLLNKFDLKFELVTGKLANFFAICCLGNSYTALRQQRNISVKIKTAGV